MNDDRLITAVREPFTDIHLDIPVEQIVSRGRSVRTRRRLPGLAGAAAAAAAVALAVAALVPGSHAAGQPANARPAAWTVAEQANGTLYVTIRQLSDPAELQGKLRADGVAASITFAGKRNPSCLDYTKGNPRLMQQVIAPYHGNGKRYTVLVIHPAALPGDAGVQIVAELAQHPTQGGVAIGLMMGLVQASPRCTGS